MRVFVDDCLCCGNKAAVKNAILQIQKYFCFKIEDTMIDYLSCEVVFSKNKKRAWMGTATYGWKAD